MRATEDVIKQNKTAIILVPEIALIPQLVERFSARFGNIISVMHSGLTDKKRREAGVLAAAGKSKIIIGTRLALFAPVKELGLIVLDEEYENSYKSEANPRYNAREVALKLAELKRAVVILGSATPSLETYYKAEIGEYRKVELPERIDKRPLPPVQIINMADEIARRNRGIFSRKLKEEIEGCLARKEQVILFVNRRGHFTYAMCGSCRKTIECPKCSVSLAYYSSDRRLHCHMCGYSVPENIICPHCEDAKINLFGIGTERIEEEIKKYFPQARLLRIDGGVTNIKKDHEKNHQQLVSKNVDILIGTQMIAKGLDLPGVTLVGVVSADSMLYADDFRSSERTFQLLTQVSGRAGRGTIPGKVIVQTNNPDHYAIRSASKHDYAEFYNNEIKQRKDLRYPPFSNLISILISGKNKENAFELSKQMKVTIKNGGFEVMGPVVAPLAKKRDEWRFQLLVKRLNRQVDLAGIISGIEIPYGIKCVVDVDPL
jgi:primosomal protein N' (replication factor Y)